MQMQTLVVNAMHYICTTHCFLFSHAVCVLVSYTREPSAKKKRRPEEEESVGAAEKPKRGITHWQGSRHSTRHERRGNRQRDDEARDQERRREKEREAAATTAGRDQ